MNWAKSPSKSRGTIRATSTVGLSLDCCGAKRFHIHALHPLRGRIAWINAKPLGNYAYQVTDSLVSFEFNTFKKLTFVIIRLHLAMTFTVKQLDEFSDWLKSLKDSLTRQRLVKRLRKAQLGNLGDVEKVGEGVFEMREHFGPGWRMYYIQHGELLIVMLGGGDKSTQQADIRRALALAKTLEN